MQTQSRGEQGRITFDSSYAWDKSDALLHLPRWAFWYSVRARVQCYIIKVGGTFLSGVIHIRVHEMQDIHHIFPFNRSG